MENLMKMKENDPMGGRANPENEKDAIATDCVHRTAEWLGFYSNILSELRQASPAH
jgi:hypothetical protein